MGDYTVKQHGEWREVVTHPAYAWMCEHCGWLGLECSSENFAHQEASRHVAECPKAEAAHRVTLTPVASKGLDRREQGS